MSFRRQSMLLVLLTIILRLPVVLHPKYIDDEGGYAVVAHELLQGGTLYISALDRKPPLLFWIYTAIFFQRSGKKLRILKVPTFEFGE